MTTYAYDGSTTHLLAVWGSGAGASARTVARLHVRTPEPYGLRLAKAMTELSSTAWLSYTDADLAGPVPVVTVLEAIRDPNLPRSGRLRVEPDWLVERGHDIGRTLVDIGSSGVRRAVLADLTEEFDGIERALRGDLAGRARQAVELTRLDAPPGQVAAADRLLFDVPMGGERLFTDVEPTAACVAAAHWLHAAVDATLTVTGRGDPGDVLRMEEAIEHFDVVAPRVVLALMGNGGSPLAVVQRLVGAAMMAARGQIPPEDLCEMPGYILLDPARPSRHLLDRLAMALRTCGRVYGEHLDRKVLGAHPESDRVEAARQIFDAHVRREAERSAERLSATAPP